MTANRDDEYCEFIPQKLNYEIVDQSFFYQQQKPLLNQQQIPPGPNLLKNEELKRNDSQLQQQFPSEQRNSDSSLDSRHQSTRKGVFHQIIATCAVLLLASGCGMPIGYSAVLLPQLATSNDSHAEVSYDIDFIEMSSWLASLHSLATPIGSFCSGPLADSIGRRSALFVAVVPLILGWCTMALAKSFAMLVVGRLLCGFGVGILGGPAQVYIAETAEPKLRSLLIGAPFVSYSFGILIVYILGSVLHWRYVAWCGIVFPALAALALCCIPESPAWLLRNGKEEKALKALTYLRGNDIAAQKQMNDMIERLKQEKATTKTNENIFKLCCQRVAIKPLFIVISFSMLHILTGTFIVVFYAIDIIAEFGADFDTKTAAIWTAVVRIICTFVFCFVLLFIKRRPIIVVSSIVSGISCLVMSIYMYANLNSPKSSADMIVAGVCLLTYIAFNTALMVMPGIMIGELFPARIRGRTAGAVFAAMNIALFSFTKVFPMLQAQVKIRGVFLIFGIAGFICALFMFMYQPETKDRTLDEIEDYFNENNWLWWKRNRSLERDGRRDFKNREQKEQLVVKA